MKPINISLLLASIMQVKNNLSHYPVSRNNQYHLRVKISNNHKFEKTPNSIGNSFYSVNDTFNCNISH